MKILKLLLFGLGKADEESLPLNRYFTTGTPPVTYIQPEEPEYFDLDLNFYLQEGFEQYSQRPVTMNSLMRGRMGGLNPRARNPHEKVSFTLAYGDLGHF